MRVDLGGDATHTLEEPCNFHGGLVDGQGKGIPTFSSGYTNLHHKTTTSTSTVHQLSKPLNS
jgi:hypothetical protein